VVVSAEELGTTMSRNNLRGITLGIRPILGINSLTFLPVYPLLYKYIVILSIVVRNMAQPVQLCDLQNTSQVITTRYRRPERETRFQKIKF